MAEPTPEPTPPIEPARERPRVVVVGGGFGGLETVKALRRAPVDVVLLDRNNYHLFQPLLYQVASAALSPADIAAPLRSVLHRQRNADVILAEVTAIDLASRVVHAGDRSLQYGFLVLAAGVVDDYFGHDAWERSAPGLKTLQSAIAIRSRVLLSFEAADIAGNPREQDELMTFVIVGGGPTGVEMAGAIKELAVDSIARDFRHIDTTRTRVILVEAGDRLLPGMHPDCSARARRDLEGMGVEVVLGSPASEIGPRRVRIGDRAVRSANIIWAAGVKAVPLAHTLGIPLGRGGRVPVGRDLSITGHPEAFVIGDLAEAHCGRDGSLVPGVAPAAMQMGRFVGRLIGAETAARVPSARKPFVYRDKGTMATIGRSKAVAQIGHWRFGGLLAWLLWSGVHIAFLIEFRNRLAVLFSWAYSYLLFKRGARLITNERAEDG
ncbi:MAG: NAD(P)/FAD-dependent oxidoreductase [Phycisphaerales bacterium]|nr:NAD(P)/FAD-dependent oxidoreductase [Phycisphaerales bacterium]